MVAVGRNHKRKKQNLERGGETGSGVHDRDSLRMIFFVVSFSFIYWLLKFFFFFFCWSVNY